MTPAASPCRTYIVYHHGLFAQGVRSVLEKQRGVQIVGMESNLTKALKAVRSLRPQVILLEESTEKGAGWPFIQLGAAGRIVTLSLDHCYATVYDQHRIAVSDPAELVKAIRGRGRQHIARPDQHHLKASMFVQPESGRNGHEGRPGEKPPVRRTRREEATKVQYTPRASRARKGG